MRTDRNGGWVWCDEFPDGAEALVLAHLREYRVLTVVVPICGCDSSEADLDSVVVFFDETAIAMMRDRLAERVDGPGFYFFRVFVPVEN